MGHLEKEEKKEKHFNVVYCTHDSVDGSSLQVRPHSCLDLFQVLAI
jgi:hypothetical protein